MKQLLLSFFFLFSMGSLFAQQDDLTLSHSDTVFTSSPLDEIIHNDLIAHTYVRNNSRQSMNLRWELTNFSQPAGWETYICDSVNCFPSGVLSNVVIGGNPYAPVPLEPGNGSLIDLHLSPNDVTGTGYAQICFSTAEEPDNIFDCMTYKFTVSATSSTEETLPYISQIFPNPTSEYFGLTNVNSTQELQIFNSLGKKQYSYEVAPGKRYYVGDLPTGMYLVAFLNKKGKITKTTRLVKQLYRP